MTLAGSFQSETGTIASWWDWHDCSQVMLLRLFSSDAGTIVPKWCWHDCSQETLAWFWFVHWHDSSLVSFTSEESCHVTGLWHMISKNAWPNYLSWYDFKPSVSFCSILHFIAFCLLKKVVANIIWTLTLPYRKSKIVKMCQQYGHDNNLVLYRDINKDNNTYLI